MNPNFKFHVHMPIEFLYALYALGTKQHFYTMIKQFNIEPCENVVSLLDTMEISISRYMSQELRYFYDLDGLGFIFYKFILLNPGISNIEIIIESIHQMDEKQLLQLIFESIYKKNDHLNFDDIPNLIKAINESSFQSEERKLRVIDYIENAFEIKQRFYLFLSHFYKYCFKPVEQEVKDFITSKLEKYKNLYASQPNMFIKQYLSLKEPYLNSIDIHLSLFKYIQTHQYIFNNEHWLVLGLYSDLLYSDQKQLENFSSVFKALSDINRLQILKLLSERPYFGQELADLLKITSATVSYHISFFQQLGLVTFNRIDNRSYYEFNKTKLTDYLNDFINQM